MKNKTQNKEQKIREIESYIGGTPLFHFENLSKNPNVKIAAKLEWQQLGGSVKARPAYNIIKEAIISGDLNSKKTFIDASSGNTAIAYASIAANLGINIQLFIPENASEQRKNILTALGAELVYTSPLESTDGAQDAAQDRYDSNPEHYFYADQYANDNNWKAHYRTTGNEILKQSNEKLTHFIAGLGTTGTFTGTTRKIKEYDDSIQTIELQPDSPMHGFEGWKHLETAQTPKIYDPSLADTRATVSSERSFPLIKQIACEYGLLISPSASANLLGAINLSEQISEGYIVTVLSDSFEKYNELYNQIF